MEAQKADAYRFLLPKALMLGIAIRDILFALSIPNSDA
jgi:hypothetical protein